MASPSNIRLRCKCSHLAIFIASFNFVSNTAAQSDVAPTADGSALTQDGFPASLDRQTYPGWAKCYKTFYSRNLSMCVISQSACPWQAFPTQSNVCGQGQARSLPQCGAPGLAKCFTLKKHCTRLVYDCLEQVWQGYVRLGQVRLAQVRLCQVWLGQVWLGQVWLGLVRLGQVWLGQVWLGLVRFGQVRLGQDRFGRHSARFVPNAQQAGQAFENLQIASVKSFIALGPGRSGYSPAGLRWLLMFPSSSCRITPHFCCLN